MGYAPAELLLGRPMVYSIELDQNEVDIEGTELTQLLADALIAIHNEAFGEAGKALKKWQERYARAYDKKHKGNPLKLRKGSKCQIFDYSANKKRELQEGCYEISVEAI